MMPIVIFIHTTRKLNHSKRGGLLSENILKILYVISELLFATKL
jgi:hypothetical protein